MGHHFRNIVSYLTGVYYKWNIFCLKPIQSNGYLVSTVKTDGLVLVTKSLLTTELSIHPWISSCLWVTPVILILDIYSWCLSTLYLQIIMQYWLGQHCICRCFNTCWHHIIMQCWLSQGIRLFDEFSANIYDFLNIDEATSHVQNSSMLRVQFNTFHEF